MDTSFASAASLDDVQPKQTYVSKLFIRKEVDEKDETDLVIINYNYVYL